MIFTNRNVFVFPSKQLQMEETKFSRKTVSSLPVAFFSFTNLQILNSAHGVLIM